MSEVRHTPGPWAVNPVVAQVDAFDSEGIGPVCQMLWPTTLRDEAETEANARLIAAAPELLTALKQWADNPDGWSVDQVNAAQAIIRKATGSDTDRAIATASSKP